MRAMKDFFKDLKSKLNDRGIILGELIISEVIYIPRATH